MPYVHSIKFNKRMQCHGVTNEKFHVLQSKEYHETAEKTND